MKNNFNFIAPIFDGLAKLIFGDYLIRSQCYFLSKIEPSDSVLILGGGTGEILESFPPCQKIDFLDLSRKMIEKAQKRPSKNKVEFLNVDFLKMDLNTSYDVIICPFFLDCFDQIHLRNVLAKIKGLLKSNGRLIVTDFQETKKNRFLLGFMHYFFRMFAGLQSKKLKNIHGEVQMYGFEVKEEKFFHRNTIFSRVYRNLY